MDYGFLKEGRCTFSKSPQTYLPSTQLLKNIGRMIQFCIFIARHDDRVMIIKKDSNVKRQTSDTSTLVRVTGRENTDRTWQF